MEARRLLSTSTLTSIASFDGTDGYNPVAAVADSAGDIFGITSFVTAASGGYTSGVVFEVPVGSGTIKDLATLPSIPGQPYDEGQSLIIDSAGDLYGSCAAGIFEVPTGTGTLRILTPFLNDLQVGTVSAVDSKGDLFGITQADGGVYELPVGSSTQELDLFGADNGVQTLQLGPDGNLYGTAAGGIVEDSLTTGASTTLATFNTATTGTDPTGLTFDASGNLWGFCDYGGPNGDGTVWEYQLSTQTLVEQAAFTASTGGGPVTAPVIDTSGTIYGLTSGGGANGDGTLFSVSTTGAAADLTHVGTVTPAVATATIVDNADLNSGQPTNGAAMVTGSPSFLWDPDGVAFITPPEQTPAKTSGGVWSGRLKQPTPPATTNPKPADWEYYKRQVQDYPKKLSDTFDEIDALRRDLANDFKGVPADVRAIRPASTQASITSELAAVTQLTDQVTADIKAGLALVGPGIASYDRSASLTKAVTALNAKLAKATNAASEAKLQSQVAADTAAANAAATTDNTDYTQATDDLTAITTDYAQAQQELAAIPALVVTLGGSVVTLTGSVAPGGAAQATLTVNDTGTVPVDGALAVQLFAQPVDTDQKVTLSTVTTTVDIAAGGSATVSLTFPVPKKLAAGSYSLLVQLDPHRKFTKGALAGLITSSQTLVVT